MGTGLIGTNELGMVCGIFEQTVFLF